jgi:hypothetical protein
MEGELLCCGAADNGTAGAFGLAVSRQNACEFDSVLRQ